MNFERSKKMDEDIEIIDLEAITKKIKNVQIYPTRTRVEINDKAIKKLFGFDYKTYNQLRNGAPFYIIETTDHPKHGKIKTPYSFVSPYAEPLNEFDRAVLSVCTSEYLAGNQYTTVAIIFRALIGKVGCSDINPSKNQRAAILHSISKLLATVIKCDTTQSFSILHYDYVKIVESAILPCCKAEVSINGQSPETIIYFDRISPLFDIADAKKQIIRYPASLLNVPNQNNTPMNIALKNYSLHRVAEIKAHKMTPTITFEDLFQKCRIDQASYKTQKDARESVVELFEHLKDENFIDSFTVKKRNSGKGFYGISFTYKKQGNTPLLQ